MSTRWKFVLTYVGGIVTGVVMLFVLGIIVNASQDAAFADDDVVMFDQPRSTVGAREFHILQVLPNGNALATAEDMDYVGTVVLFLANDATAYYDNQKIIVPVGKCLKQIGSYTYENRQEMIKTVPVVEFFDDEA